MAPNWSFIAQFEGKDVLNGYVPDPKNSRSGVTIATGVDLGHMGATAFSKLDDQLQTLVQPYLGLVGVKAQQELLSRPLVITETQAKALDAVAESAILGPLRSAYDAASDGSFNDLPEQAMTVMTSVAYQYSPDLAHACPNFWHVCVLGDWSGAVKELRNFGDAYPTRRNKEADYLEPLAS